MDGDCKEILHVVIAKMEWLGLYDGFSSVWPRVRT